MIRSTITKLVLLTAVAVLLGPMLADAGGFAGRRGGGGARPNINRGNMSRPNVSRPNMSRPNMGGGNLNRPNVNRPNMNRPSFNSPNVNRPPMGGTRPGPSRPNVSRPSTSIPNLGSKLPNGFPSSGSNVNRPGTTRPGNKRPNLGSGLPNRPSTLPGNTRPPIPKPDATRPGNNIRPGSGGRPSAGDLGDFLGLDKPARPNNPTRPNRPETLPERLPKRPDAGNGSGIVQRPGQEIRPGNRPNSRPVNRPGDRPSVGINRPAVDIGDINLGNNTIVNNRPSWANLNNNQFNQINNRIGNQIGGMHNWNTRYPARVDRLNRWGNGVRNHWGYYNRHPRWFGPGWWGNHPHRFCGWHYYYRYPSYSWTYWWTAPTYVGLTNWFTWQAPAQVWSQPAYYDYGSGGNVTYTDNRVFINGEDVASAEEYAQSAAELATVEAPASEEEASEAEWMPLGTFALTTDERDVSPNRVVQLAVNRDGVISGTMYNQKTDDAVSVQGQVDKDTQRVAFRIGESETVVAETGLYNLTEDEATLLVHFAADRTDNYLLVRMLEPEDEKTEEASPGAVAPNSSSNDR